MRKKSGIRLLFSVCCLAFVAFVFVKPAFANYECWPIGDGTQKCYYTGPSGDLGAQTSCFLPGTKVKIYSPRP